MSDTHQETSFRDLFIRATDVEQGPFHFQQQFAELLHPLVRVPTGAGKTAMAVLGWLWRRRFASPAIKAATPRRLVYCLPMRVLVEQTRENTIRWLAKLQTLAGNATFETRGGKQRLVSYSPDWTDPGRIGVSILMGGVEADEWYLHPEHSTILIGTQDMLLSRALNRGYAAGRFHWPIDFGLLNNDCLWVFDEPQLMGSGVSTSAQLAGLRKRLNAFGGCPSVWMSATLEPEWLNTIDFRGQPLGASLELVAADLAPGTPLHQRMTATKTLFSLEVDPKAPDAIAQAVLGKGTEKGLHQPGTQTLVVLNTVDRAKAVYEALRKIRKKAELPKLLLIHSRFRPLEREALNDRLQETGAGAQDRIVVATQVVEAGVDITARTLVTDLAPWSSVVQRIGRCNRTGEDGPGGVYWIDLPENLAPPYTPDAVAFSRTQMKKLEGAGVSPKQLDEFKTRERITLPFEHKHVLRRRDLLGLFDTAPDLSGNDIDISRFVRGDDPETDVVVFWRAGPPRNDWNSDERRQQSARRIECCSVPIGSFKKDFLVADRLAYRFDHLDGEWRVVTRRDIDTVVPGQTFWIPADQGGYDPELGWSPKQARLPEDLLVPLPTELPKSRRERPESFYDSDEWARQAEWRTVARHTDEVLLALEEMLRPAAGLSVTDVERAALRVAVRWHDWGKAHAVFQSGLRDEIDDPKEREQLQSAAGRTIIPRAEPWRGRTDIAKAPQEFWRHYARIVRPGTGDRPEVRVTVKRFRHELASALGVLQLIGSERPPGDWAELPLPSRVLAVYLIAAHHGKVRLAIRVMPDETPTPDDSRVRFASGIWEGDALPPVDLGGAVSAPRIECLSLEAMQLGTTASWTGKALEILDRLGPFRLAYLEALIRAADCRASGEMQSQTEAQHNG